MVKQVPGGEAIDEWEHAQLRSWKNLKMSGTENMNLQWGRAWEVVRIKLWEGAVDFSEEL